VEKAVHDTFAGMTEAAADEGRNSPLLIRGGDLAKTVFAPLSMPERRACLHDMTEVMVALYPEANPSLLAADLASYAGIDVYRPGA
jgi:hypothetical protein